MSLIPRILPQSAPVDTDTDPLNPGADARLPPFAALLQRHQAALGSPLLQRLAREQNRSAAQAPFQPPSQPTQREPNTAFAHAQTSRERNAAQSGAQSAASGGTQRGAQSGLPRAAPSAAIGPSRGASTPSVGANRNARPIAGRPTGSGSSQEEPHTQARTPAARREVSADEIHFARAFEFVLARASEFCSSKVVVESGIWDTQIPLNEKIMPECLLHLTLSGSDLELRFKTVNSKSKALISTHTETLKTRLTDLMQGNPVRIQISVCNP